MPSKSLLVKLLFSLSAMTSMAQVKSDSTKLPFAIDDKKLLSPEDLRHKKEGVYVTGIPDISSDPVNGFGYGAEGSIYFNGKRTDPFFKYTAYRSRIDFVLFNTTRDQREFFVKLDVPYIFNTKWRLRVEGGFEANPNLLYFGVTPEHSLKGLTYYPNQDSSQAPVTNARYSDYEKNGLTGINENYHTYYKRESVINISMERSFFGDKISTLIGIEWASMNHATFEGNSLLLNDFNQGKTIGLGGSSLVIGQFGLVYDTRDLEPDPSHGFFLEVTDEVSLKSIGSSFDFNKLYFHGNCYQQVLSSIFRRMIIAGRVGIGHTTGAAPFFELNDVWSQEGDIEGLGGPRTLRGYKISRFVGRVMGFLNMELRCRFMETTVFSQHLAFSAVPFFDAGGVWNDFGSLNTDNLRSSQGMGLRIAWNVNTVLRFDYAWSKEDNQFFFNLAHTF